MQLIPLISLLAAASSVLSLPTIPNRSGKQWPFPGVVDIEIFRDAGLDRSYGLQRRALGDGSAKVAEIKQEQLGGYFYANLTLPGNAPQPVCFDTGSSDTWVIGSKCSADSKGGCTPNQPGSVRVNDEFINTGIKGSTFYLGNGDGNSGVKYDIYNTTVSYGSAKAKNLPVGIATDLIGGIGGVGTLGMGFNAISNIAKALDGGSASGTNKRIHNANFMDHIGVSMFGIFISPNDSSRGMVNFGYMDPTKFDVKNGRVQWFPLSGDVSYTIPQGKQTTDSIVVDTGTPKLLLTTEIADYINSWFNSRYNVEKTIPCDGKPLVITLTGPPAPLSSAPVTIQYTLYYKTLAGENGKGSCTSLIVGGGEQSGTILGAPFFQAAYTVFDKSGKRMGFSPVKAGWTW
ncbi:hypothetical protein HDU79_006714 [Rhizoclosmatium sp. JEL0117]|nr:hypothetical protein HDU79_006714 [Rhizoclosmatium sp. JEL0117]